jgi:dUTP pyrophosphatase
MERIAKFEKVPFDRWSSDVYWDAAWSFEQPEFIAPPFPDKEQELYYDAIRLPERSTKGSAGYDFFAPFDFTIKPGQAVEISTGIRARIEDGWCLVLLPKSGIGSRYFVRFANTVCLIDSDYYGSAYTGGQIKATMRVEQDREELSFKRGDKMFQGVFLPFGITEDDDADGIREGGHGSTGR